MKFLSLNNAARKLNATVDGLIGIAAKGKTVLSVAIAPGISVWRVESSLPDTKGEFKISKTPAFSHINIGKQDCLDLLTNQVTPQCPIYSGGYLNSPRGPIRYNPIKDWARLKTINEPTEYRWIQLPGYTAKVLGGQLVTLKDARLNILELSKESLLIAHDNFTALKEIYLPPDEMTDTINASAFILDMNSVARDMFGRALRKRRVYPCRDEVIEALNETESFKNAADLLSDKEKKALRKFPGVAADLIRPDEVQGKGDKIISGQSYLSEKFRVLMAISRQFAETSEKQPSRVVQKKDIVKALEENRIPINMQSIAAILINPSAIPQRGRTKNSPDAEPRHRVR